MTRCGAEVNDATYTDACVVDVGTWDACSLQNRHLDLMGVRNCFVRVAIEPPPSFSSVSSSSFALDQPAHVRGYILPTKSRKQAFRNYANLFAEAWKQRSGRVETVLAEGTRKGSAKGFAISQKFL